jgi:hypothetical protein
MHGFGIQHQFTWCASPAAIDNTRGFRVWARTVNVLEARGPGVLDRGGGIRVLGNGIMMSALPSVIELMINNYRQ